METDVIFYTFLATILHAQYILQTYELPEAGRELWPKHVGAIINNNKSTVQYVGNKYCMWFLRNIDNFVPRYTASYSRSQLFLP